MKELVEYLVKNLVDDPKKVRIDTEVQDDNTTLLKLTVGKEDMGKIIGKNGKIIKALRNILKIKAIKENKRAFLQLVEQPIE